MAEETKGAILVPAPSNSRREGNVSTLPAVATETAAIMNAIASMARDPSVDPDKLIRIFEIRDRELARVARMEFIEAMAAFKANAPKIVKDKHVFFEGRDGKRATDYWHATLPNVVGSVIGGLAAVGISHKWEVKHDANQIYVACVLTHVGGHAERTEFPPVSPDISGNKNPIQAVQSAITYAQRHSLLAAIGLSAGDDDDGRGAGKGTNLPDGGNISEGQEADLQALIQENNGDLAKLLKHWKVESLADIPVANYEHCCKFVRDMGALKADRAASKRGSK